jgi:hypothetical protein
VSMYLVLIIQYPACHKMGKDLLNAKPFVCRVLQKLELQEGKSGPRAKYCKMYKITRKVGFYQTSVGLRDISSLMTVMLCYHFLIS